MIGGFRFCFYAAQCHCVCVKFFILDSHSWEWNTEWISIIVFSKWNLIANNSNRCAFYNSIPISISTSSGFPIKLVRKWKYMNIIDNRCLSCDSHTKHIQIKVDEFQMTHQFAEMFKFARKVSLSERCVGRVSSPSVGRWYQSFGANDLWREPVFSLFSLFTRTSLRPPSISLIIV